MGDIFRSLWRFIQPIVTNIGKAAIPLAKSAGKAIGQEGLATSARILSDIVQGKDIKEAVAEEGREGMRKLMEKAGNKLQKQGGSGLIKRKRKRRSSLILGDKHFIGRTVPRKALLEKKLRSDSLGFY